MTQFTPIASTIGGLLIGASALMLLVLNGRIAGISGVLGGCLRALRSGDGHAVRWRVGFMAGLVAAGAVVGALNPSAFAFEVERSHGALALAGLLVGFGTRMGGGCTSGHGVCGISRLAPRSIVATLTFIAAGAIAVTVVRTSFGGVV